MVFYKIILRCKGKADHILTVVSASYLAQTYAMTKSVAKNLALHFI